MEGINHASVYSRYKSFIDRHYRTSFKYVFKYLLQNAHLMSSSSDYPLSLTTRDVSRQKKESCVERKNWLILCNAQSLFRKLDELRALVSATNPSFICVTETWFLPEIDDSLVQIPGFISFRNDRQDNPLDRRRGGGCIIYASHRVNPQVVVLPLEPTDFVKPFGVEYSLIRMTDPTIAYLMCIYIPPGLSSECFNHISRHIVRVLDYVLSLTPNASLYVCGDFNRYNLSFLTGGFGLNGIVHLPTFGDAILDNFFCEVENEFEVKIAPPLGTAVNLHKIVIVSRNMKSSDRNTCLHKVFDLRSSNVKAFCERILQTDWSHISLFDDINECVEYFYSQFSLAMSAIPVSFVKITSKTKPWITPVVIDLINKRWKAYRCKNYSLYNHYKTKVKSEIFKSKLLWSKRMRSSSKGIWSVVNNIREKSESNVMTQIVNLFPDAQTAAESVNCMFGKLFHCSGTVSEIDISMFNDLQICDHLIVRRFLKSLRTDKAMGSDQIPPVLLKLSADEICRPLSYIYNYSFNTVTVPILWKIADVCPIPKTKPVSKDKLRPISLLPIISKINEKIVLKNFRDYLLSFYDDHQFAYRRDSSTVSALIKIHDSVLRYLDDPNIAGVRIIAFDMSNAFNCVPHTILYDKLCVLEFPQSRYFAEWIKSYLMERRQRVRLGSTTSSLVNVTSGVPQGSNLGPYLFAIFMSTFCAADSRTSLVKFADDVTLIVPVYKSKINDLSVVCMEIENFQKWCTDNQMLINSEKTKMLNVSASTDPLSPVPSMNTVDNLRILGLIFNNKLNWSSHFDHVCSMVSSRLYVLRVLRSLLTHDELIQVFNAIVRSIIDYASPVFLNPGKCLDLRISRLCKRAFHIIHGHDVKTCASCNMLNVQERREMLAMRLFMKVKNDRNNVLHKLIPMTSDRSDRLILPHVRTTRRMNGFFVSCSLMYNDRL